MHYMTSQEIRNTWLNFFKERGHMIEPGASLIPHNDPSLLWINAGVAALKKYFDGSEIPESKRITNVQKCIRTNDIENVGKTARHHTFFEMLGNFSIGDYFRKEVIPWAYDILTNPKYFDLPKEKLYVTYHPDDLETKDLWIKAGLDATHLIPLEGNFWQIGEGPCGPNTEVFFDRGEKRDKDHIGVDLLRNDIENDRYIEIWGIVFSQFNAVNGVKREDYKELPHKNIDTGAGLERICCVIQGTDTNFETDLFLPIIKETEKICKKPYEGKYLMPYRVIADHIRTCTFALADGETFSNEGRGYVLRRLLRRAMRYGQKLGLYEPFLYKLVDTVVSIMKPYYPYLVGKEESIKKTIENEEKRFIKTLSTGENILATMIKDKKELSGDDAFKLYDTYGFPIELTVEMCSEEGVKVDMNGFNASLEKQKELARASRKNIESFNKQSKDLLDFVTPSEYVYDDKTIRGKVIGLFKDGVKVDSIDDEGEVALDKTNFYAEMGGQVADTGFIENKECEANVLNVTKAPNKQHLHHVKVLYGTIKLGDEFTLEVDHKKHFAIQKNHSATHLLQAALISVLGDECRQKGSFVNESYLRFDFSFNRKITQLELNRIEKKVNEFIESSIENNTLVLPIEKAKEIGAISLFDEKYGKEVRVVCFGDVSKEFCGGNHVKNSSDIGCFAIVSEGAIASGVRRIEARTSYAAYEYLKSKDDLLTEVKESLGSKGNSEILPRISTLNADNTLLNQKLNALLKELSVLKSNEILNDVKVNGFAVKYFDDLNKQGLMNVLDYIKSNTNDYVLVLIGKEDTKYPLLVASSKSMIEKGISSGKLAKKVTGLLGGNGGGKDDRAQGSVLDVSKIDQINKEFIF